MQDNPLYQKFNEIKQKLNETEAEFLAAHQSLSTENYKDLSEAESEQHAKTLLFYESVLGVISSTNAKLEEIVIEQ